MNTIRLSDSLAVSRIISKTALVHMKRYEALTAITTIAVATVLPNRVVLTNRATQSLTSVWLVDG